MRLAVQEGDPHVDDRDVVVVQAMLQLRSHTLLDRADELGGHGAADDLLGEFDAGTAGERCHLDVADRVLPVPAGLLDEAAVATRGLGEGLAHGDLDRNGVHACSGRSQPVQHDISVRLAQAPEHELPGVRAAFHPHRGVARRQPPERLGERVLVASGRRLDGDRQQRLGQRPGFHQQRRGLVRHGVPGLGNGEATDRADVTGYRLVDRA